MNQRNFDPVEYQDRAGDGTADGTSGKIKSTEPVDQSVFKPGWYGEADQDDVTCVLVSFKENAVESRQFQRRLNTPVSYATLSIMNLGLKPAVVDSLKLKLYAGGGRHYDSLPAEELLSERRSLNGDLLLLLETPKTLKAGQMLSSIPICMPASFDWGGVTSVVMTVNGKPLKIDGKMLTAEEKQKMVESSPAQTKEKEDLEKDRKPASPMNVYDNL